MRLIRIDRNFDSWRDAARRLLSERARPQDVLWSDQQEAVGLLPGLAADEVAGPTVNTSPTAVPRAYVDIAERVACHRDLARWNLLYTVLWRLTVNHERHLLDIASDDDVRQLAEMEKAVSRDRHKMTAFVRFRLTERDGEPWYIAFHRPDHFIVRLAAPFFARRFAPMKWAILTPDESVWWDTSELTFGPGVGASEAPPADELEDLWRTYYAGIFNPARIKLKAMKREMPVRHWATLPETELIPDLLRDAPRRVEEMMATQKRNARKAGKTPPGRSAHEPAEIKVSENVSPTPGQSDGLKFVDPDTCAVGKSAAEFLPPKIELPQLRAASASCRGCPIYCNATQTVFGEGPIHASVMFVGEQPGDQEDRAGKPFVGPAGQLLDRALEEAGVPRADCYVTNAVKHFKWEPRGKRRLHAKPSAREVSACRPWLEAEIQAIRPKTIVCLGATAAQSLLGRDFRVTQHRGEPMKTEWADWLLATIHPSSLLRIPDAAQREVSYAEFVDDLRLVAKRIQTVS